MIGVFLCHCGTNIAGVVDIAALRDCFSQQGYFVEDHLFLCSKAGQEMIKGAIKEKGLDRVAVASCSPKHHGEIFKECVGEVINPYMWEMANIREQCAWTTSDKKKATRKAESLISSAIRRVEHRQPILSIDVPVLKKVAVIGGGIAGMHAALELADKGLEVVLIEKEPNIGGNMVKLDRTFPTDDCAMCTVSPILNEVMMNRRIAVHTMTKVEKFEGRPGEYRITLKRRPRFVDYEKCTGCGECTRSEVQLNAPMIDSPTTVDRIRISPERCEACGACAKACTQGAIVQTEKKAVPTYDGLRCVGCWNCKEACKFGALDIINVCPVVVPSEFDMGLGYRKAIYIPNSQAVPLKYLRDPAHCLLLNHTMDCQGCRGVCGPGAILDEDAELEHEISVGAVVVATGYQQYDLSRTEYHVENPNVINGLQLERLLSPAGPTGGKLLRPSDGRMPKSVTFIQCAGSRDIDR
ncbi:MAG: FAD-dependent oxidoreductase, partial [Methanomassiliicoccales archaeon]|nr:FAD-dependent oxidoreductase [Methanomassiliicoccales archaeon]